SSSAPLIRYLFGQEQEWYHDATGQLVITESPVAFHQNNLKRIPSGFFKLDGAEHISGVLFTNSGTIPKFLRMGHQKTYRDPDLKVLRMGLCYRHDPNATLPEPFMYEVGHKNAVAETWRQGTVLIKNPNALHPLPDEWLGAGCEYDLVAGKSVMTWREPFIPFTSLTQILGRMSRKTFDMHAATLWAEFTKDHPI
ncbi:MAG: hypothetical protein RR609_09160, partial [Aurantimicrobium sp.]